MLWAADLDESLPLLGFVALHLVLPALNQLLRGPVGIPASGPTAEVGLATRPQNAMDLLQPLGRGVPEEDRSPAYDEIDRIVGEGHCLGHAHHRKQAIFDSLLSRGV